MAEFLEAYRLTNINEGGYVNDPTDSGGETYCGISRKNFPNWQGWKIVDGYKPITKGDTIKDVILEGLKKSFYKNNFWDKCKLDFEDNQELANNIYDTAVLEGVSFALKNKNDIA